MQELALIFLIVVVVFGAKRILEIMGGLGEGIRSFKKALEAVDPPSAPPEVPAAEHSSGVQPRDAVSHGGKPSERTGASSEREFEARPDDRVLLPLFDAVWRP